MKFLGYERGSKAYRFLDGNRNVVISRSANFCEHENWDRVHGNSQVFIPISDTRRSGNRHLFRTMIFSSAGTFQSSLDLSSQGEPSTYG